MSGSFSNTRRKPCSAPSFASEVPGSVTATKCEPSPCSEWKYLNCDIVSIVPPDFDETMNSVVLEVEGVAHGADLVRMRGVEHVQADRAVAERAAEHLRPEAGAAHAEQHRVGDARVAHLGRERAQVVGLGRQPLGDVEPAEPVGQLRRALGRPQGPVAIPETADDLFVRGGPQPLVDRRLETGGQLALDAHGASPYPHFYCTKASGVRT